jgi:hypothetical protein
MVLNKWTTGDTITEIAANNRGIRKGTEAEIAAIPTASNEIGDVTHNSTNGFLQVQTAGGASDKRGNIAILLGADSTEVTHVGVTPTQKKDIDFIKSDEGFSGNQITIVAMIKTNNAGTTAHLIVEKDGGPTDELDLTTTSLTYEKVTGQIDISADTTDAVHTLEFYLQDGSGDTVSLKQLEVYGI